MKKIIISFIIFSFILTSAFYSGNTANSSINTGYGRILKDGVMIYSANNLDDYSAMFEITNGYYVFILDINASGNFYPVEYQDNNKGYSKITGFVLKNEVTIWDSPTAPYFADITATVKTPSNLTRLPISASTIPDTSEPNSITGLSYSQAIVCYGKYFNQSENITYYYVRRVLTEGVFFTGYFVADNLDVRLPDPHPDPIPTPTPETPSPTTSTDPDGSQIISPPNENDDTLQIILIAAICIPALVVVYLMFKPSKYTRRKRYKKYYDDEDDM